MPKEAKTHAQNRACVCIVCFEKGSDVRKCTEININRVRQFVLEDFDTSNPKLPSGLCARCRKLLEKVEKQEIGVEVIPDWVDFSKLEFPVITRSSGVYSIEQLVHCNCSICLITKNPVGTKSNRKSPYKAGRPITSIPTLPLPKPVKLCQRCFSVIGKGIKHPQPCTLTDRRDNIGVILEEDPRGLEIVASNVVRDKIEATKDKKVKLATQSPYSLLTITEPKPQSRVKALYSDKPMPASELRKMMQVNNMSLNQVKKQSFMIRTWQGRKSIEPGSLNTLVEMDSSLQSFFKSEDLEFEGHKKTNVLRSITYCNDVNGLLEYIKQNRGYSSDCTLRSKIGIDSGGGFLKVCLNLDQVDNNNLPNKKAKFSYKEGACASEFKDSGVKKIIILAIVEDVTESYGNLKIILDLLGIQNIDCVHAMDMKAANAFIGIGSASSTFPCTWCEMKKSDFGNEENMFTGGNLRTLGSIRENALIYHQALQGHKGKTKLSSANYLNCEHPPGPCATKKTIPLFYM